MKQIPSGGHRTVFFNRTISVSVKGNKKTAFIGTLRETLNDIFGSYKSDKPELQYRVERFGQIPEEVEKTSPVWVSSEQVLTHSQMNIPFLDPVTRQLIPMDGTVQIFNIKGDYIKQGGRENTLVGKDFSNKTFNFSNCNFDLQGALRELSKQLEQTGNTDKAIELKDAAEALIPVEESNDKKEVKRSGALNGARRIVEQLSDETSLLNQTVKGVKTGATIVKDILKAYGAIQGWMG